MFRFLTYSIVIVLLLFNSLTAFGIRWENLFEAKTQDARAKVEIDRHSIKSKLIKDKKIITFRLRYNHYTNDEHLKAINNYRVDCSNYDAYLTKSDLALYKNNKLVSTVNNIKGKKLTGKDYEDLKKIIEDLCK